MLGIVTRPVVGRRGLAIAAFAAAVFTAGVPAAVPDRLHRLDLYSEGRYEEAIRDITLVAHMEAIYDDLVGAGGTWVLAAANEEQGRRRLIAATFALEVATVQPPRDAPTGRGMFDLSLIRERLVAWGAVTLVQRVPAAPTIHSPPMTVARQSHERLWYHAAAALLQNGATYRALVKPADDEPALRPPVVFPLLDDIALRRFPADPVLMLARAGALLSSAGASVMLMGDRRPSDRHGRSFTFDNGRAGQAESIYRTLLDDPVVGADAHLRLGFLRFLRGDESGARRLLAEADRRSTDADARYCARLLTAWAWQVEKRHDEALAAYRAALDLAPNAHSAAVPMAFALQTDGRLAEAEALLHAALIAVPRPRDPLVTFDRSDGRTFPERLRALKATLRR